MSACPTWCEQRHPAEYPVHTRDVGVVEVGTWAFDVALFQNDTGPAEVALYVHTGDGDDTETIAVHLAPEQADTLRRALRLAVHLLGGAS